MYGRAFWILTYIFVNIFTHFFFSKAAFFSIDCVVCDDYPGTVCTSE